MFGKVSDEPRKIFLLILEIESSQLRLSLKLSLTIRIVCVDTDKTVGLNSVCDKVCVDRAGIRQGSKTTGLDHLIRSQQLNKFQ